MNNTLASGILLFVLALSSCNIINPDEQIPTYVKIDSITVASLDPVAHGSVSSNITDVWVYVNNSNIGNFELPAEIPILLDIDSANVSFYAGIKVDGQSFLRRRYIFYTPYSGLIKRLPGKIQSISPRVEYRPSNVYHLIVDFENGNSFVSYSTTDTSIARMNIPPYVYEGAFSGLIALSGAKRTSQSITTQTFKLPSNRESFVELDYKNDIPFTIEVQLSAPNAPVVVTELLSINTRMDWNKIYINLTNIAVNYPNSNISLIFKTALSPSQNEGFVAIDNVKIISQ